jgi:hypothetical protein
MNQIISLNMKYTKAVPFMIISGLIPTFFAKAKIVCALEPGLGMISTLFWQWEMLPIMLRTPPIS